MKKHVLAAASIGALAFAGLAFATPAAALTCGTPALLINGPSGIVNAIGDEPYDLWWYGPEGTLLETVPMASTSQGYGDIALSADAQTVYGVQNGSPDDDVIDLVDVNTGNIKGTLTITGPAAGIGGWVGATIVGDGKLVIGSGGSNLVFKVDLATGASTQFTDLAAFTDPGNPNFFNTTGDFAQLPDGDVIVLYTNSDNADYFLGRIAPDGTMMTVGMVPEIWGAGRVNDDIYFAQADADISKIAIADIPSTAGVAPLSLTFVVTSGQSELWGAAGTQDSGSQTCPSLANTGVDALTLGALAAGLGIAGATGLVIARRKSG